jgi:hypothetical protein
MNDILLITGPEEHDDELVTAAAAVHPHRVTVLMEADAPTWTWDETNAARERADRLAGLITRVERTTGALVVGLVGDPRALDTTSFDTVLTVHRSTSRLAAVA